MHASPYTALAPETVATYLAQHSDIAAKLGGTSSAWKVREVGDGNLNLVFIVEGPAGGVIVKQALPYVRLVGESWPLPLERAYYESQALAIQGQFAPQLIPQVYHVDRAQALIVMEYLNPHIILRKGMIAGTRYPKATQAIAEFMAQTLFNTSTLNTTAETHKHCIGIFAPNTALCKITEDLVFTDPYRVAELNRWTSPQLDNIKKEFENDTALKIAVQEKKWQFMTSAEALLHGDLHSGSVMVTESDTRIIDPEFAFVGPMGFDVGAVTANYLLSYFSHAGQRTTPPRNGDYENWVLAEIPALWNIFEKEFLQLWSKAQNGDAFTATLFTEPSAISQLNDHHTKFMRQLFVSTLQFAGCKMIRRILGLAHVADLETIVDPDVRSKCETMALRFARNLILHAKDFKNMEHVNTVAKDSAS